MLLAGVAVAVGACAQWMAGFGFALVCGPLLISSLGSSGGLRLILTLSTLISLAILATTFRSLRLRDALMLAAPGIVLTPVLVAALRGLNEHVTQAAAGAVTVAAAAALAGGLRVERLRGPIGAATAGSVSAAMNVLGGLSGPSAALYAVNAGWPADAVRPTLQVFGLVLNAVALISIGGPSISWSAIVALAVGGCAGALLARRTSATTARRTVLAVAGLGGLYTVARGLAP